MMIEFWKCVFVSKMWRIGRPLSHIKSMAIAWLKIILSRGMDALILKSLFENSLRD